MVSYNYDVDVKNTKDFLNEFVSIWDYTGGLLFKKIDKGLEKKFRSDLYNEFIMYLSEKLVYSDLIVKLKEDNKTREIFVLHDKYGSSYVNLNWVELQLASSSAYLNDLDDNIRLDNLDKDELLEAISLYLTFEVIIPVSIQFRLHNWSIDKELKNIVQSIIEDIFKLDNNNFRCVNVKVKVENNNDREDFVYLQVSIEFTPSVLFKYLIGSVGEVFAYSIVAVLRELKDIVYTLNRTIDEKITEVYYSVLDMIENKITEKKIV